jgi:hypothetical protein
MTEIYESNNADYKIGPLTVAFGNVGAERPKTATESIAESSLSSKHVRLAICVQCDAVAEQQCLAQAKDQFSDKYFSNRNAG